MKLFDFNKNGNIIDSETIKSSKIAIDFCKKLQANKAMPPNWKLDIFIDENVDSLSTRSISSDSAAYQKGKFEYGIFLNKKIISFCSKYITLIASFPTIESARTALPKIIIFIKYRYNIELIVNESF